MSRNRLPEKPFVDVEISVKVRVYTTEVIDPEEVVEMLQECAVNVEPCMRGMRCEILEVGGADRQTAAQREVTKALEADMNRPCNDNVLKLSGKRIDSKTGQEHF